MVKEIDWNDKFTKDPTRAKEEFDKLEAELTGGSSIVVQLEEYNEELKVMNKLNSQHIFVNTLGGKNYVTTRIWNEVTEREEIEFVPLETFKNMYINKFVKNETDNKIMTEGMFWLADSGRNTVDSVVFDPSESNRIIDRNDKKYLNMCVS